MKPIGTILPSKKSLAANDKYAAESKARKEKIANLHPVLKDCDVQFAGFEKRYYLTPTRYAIISASFEVLWFNVTKDGDFAMTGWHHPDEIDGRKLKELAK